MSFPVILAVSVVSAVLALHAQAPKSSTGTCLIVGIVVDAASGKPVSGAIVSISSGAPPNRFTREAPAPLPRILTGPDGRLVFRDLRAGNYRRRVAGVRPDDQGRYRVSNLPPGEYFAVVEDNVAPNEWFDPMLLGRLSAKAIRIALGPNEARTQDFVAR